VGGGIFGGNGGGVSWDEHANGIFRGNQVLSNSSDRGGGLFESDASPALQWNEFRSNTAASEGGGIDFRVSSGGTIESNKIVGNVSGGAAGGIYVSLTSNATFRGDLIQDNVAPHGTGGGIYVDNATVVLDHEVVLRNHAGAWGGGVTIWGGTASIKNSTIVLNQGDQGGGNVHFRRGSNLTLQNSIVAFSPGGGVVQDAADGPNQFVWITCSDVSNNASGDYVGLSAPPSDNRVISLDPLFCDLASLDVHLGSSSPCAASAGCLQMGALDVSCESVATEPVTWGKLKARYH
jgi:hypothetical protein